LGAKKKVKLLFLFLRVFRNKEFLCVCLCIFTICFKMPFSNWRLGISA